MTFPLSVDPDRLLREANSEMRAAIRGWLNGPPQEEVALLSRITERLGRTRRACDVGRNSPLSVTPRFEVWHRRDGKGGDKYGCDLALTISVPQDEFLKTACIQLKRCRRDKVDIDAGQVATALSDKEVGDRAFTVAVDQERGTVHIAATRDLQKASGSTDCGSWMGLTEWFLRWMKCEIGAAEPSEGHTFEQRMSLFAVSPEATRDLDEPAEEIGSEEGYRIAKVWAELVLHGNGEGPLG